MSNRNQWLGWESPPGGGLFTRDHKDPSFAYFLYKSQITDLHKLIESIELAWDFSFRTPQAPYIAHVGDYLTKHGHITSETKKSDVYFEFNQLLPTNTKPILRQQALASVIGFYTSYLKGTLSFILPASVDKYPKTIKIDLKEATSAIELEDLIVKSSLPEISALGFSDYPSLKRRCIELGIYPSSNNKDIMMIERLISKRNQILHFHPGNELIQSGRVASRVRVSEREMWASIRGFSRVVNGIEKRCMKKYRVWSGFYMLDRFAKSTGKWLES